jgi:O-antigen/teichoic acid export membrane protein
MLRLASPLLASLLLNVVLVRADVLMLERLRGSLEVGLYAAPVRLVEIANLLPALVMTSVFPLFAASHPSDPARIARLFRTSLTALVVLLVPVVLVESLAAGPIVRTLFGSSFAGAAFPLPWLAAAELLVFADIVLTARFLATGRETRNLQCVGVAAILNVTLNLVAIPRWGGAGAAGATLVAYLARLAMSFAFDDTRSAGRDTFAALAPATASGIVAAGVAWLITPNPLLRTLVALGVFGLLVLVFRGSMLGPLREATRGIRPFPVAGSRGAP